MVKVTMLGCGLKNTNDNITAIFTFDSNIMA